MGEPPAAARASLGKAVCLDPHGCVYSGVPEPSAGSSGSSYTHSSRPFPVIPAKRFTYHPFMYTVLFLVFATSSLCLETPSFASLPGSLPCRFSWSWPEQCPLTAGPSVFFHVPVITTVITPIMQASSLFFPSSSANCHCPTIGHGEQRDLPD